MDNDYGSDYIVIEDADGEEYEMQVNFTLEYNGATYLVTMPASEELEPEVLFFRVEEGEETLLAFVDDEEELTALYELMLDDTFEEDEEE